MLGAKDKFLLQELQSNFPLTIRPFQEIGKRFNLSEQQAIKRIRGLKNKGFIRYIGPVFDLRRLGIKSTLVALNVPEKHLTKTARLINGYPEVTHNYLRKGKFNIWFTLSATSKKRIVNLLNEVKQKAKIKQSLHLRSQKVFKIDSRFKV
jgi:DNA-binding Lrp family transcriptional regulator